MTDSAPHRNVGHPLTPANAELVSSGTFGHTAREEWARSWPLAVLGMLGLVGCSIFTFSCGVLLSDITREYGWTRAQFSSGYTVQMLFGMVMTPVAGWLVSRLGPRRVGLYGMGMFVACNAAFVLANGSIWQWRLLCMLLVVGSVMISPVVWIAALIGRFTVSRGLAIAVTLTGVGVSTIIWPPLAAACADAFGWRYAFLALSVGWATIAFPLGWYALPRSATEARDAIGKATTEGSPTLRDMLIALRSRVFLSVVAAGCLLAFVSLSINFHLIAILQLNGFTLAAAAGIVSIGGIASLIGSVTTGFVLDRVPARWVGLVMFTLPALGALTLLQAKTSHLLSLIAALAFGLTGGAEMNLLAYITSRQLDQRRFPPAYGMLQGLTTVVASFGPLAAGAVFDQTGSYHAYLWLTVPVSIAAALMIGSIPSRLEPIPR